MDIISWLLSKKYTDASILGIGGALAGKNCTIYSSTKSGDTTTIVFKWTADNGTERTTEIQVEDGKTPTITSTEIEGGHTITFATTDPSQSVSFNVMDGQRGVSIVGADVDDNNYLTLELSDGNTINAGQIQTVQGEDGFSPTIVENEHNTDTVYKLDITDKNGTFTTPNLKGSGGGASELTALDDVDLSSAEEGQVLTYDGTSEKWENRNLPKEIVHVNSLPVAPNIEDKIYEVADTSYQSYTLTLPPLDDFKTYINGNFSNIFYSYDSYAQVLLEVSCYIDSPQGYDDSHFYGIEKDASNNNYTIMDYDWNPLFTAEIGDQIILKARNIHPPTTYYLGNANNQTLIEIKTPTPTTYALNDLTDVTLNSVQYGDALVYDGLKWVNGSPAAVEGAVKRVFTMPTANINNEGNVVIYLGGDTGSFIRNHTYRCETNGSTFWWTDITVGSEVTVTPTLQSGTKIAEIDVDGTTTNIYAPNGGGSSLVNVIDSPISGNIGGVVENATQEIENYPLGSGTVTIVPNVASGNFSHAEGMSIKMDSPEGAEPMIFTTIASGEASHAEGQATVASGNNSHAEGGGTVASNASSHAEGIGTTASEEAAHAEGYDTTASGYTSHAEGYVTTASGYTSHAEGRNTTASGNSSHTQNEGTVAQGLAQTAIGQYNVAQGLNLEARPTDYALIIGNGSDDNNRSNALAVKWNGTVVFQDGTEQNTAAPTSTSQLTNDSNFITNAVNNLINYYTSSQTYTKAEVDAIVTAIKNGRFVAVNTLPTTNIETNVIYLVPKNPTQTNNVKDEYINLDGTTAGWEKIGDTEMDLSGYVTTTELNSILNNYVNHNDLDDAINDALNDYTDNIITPMHSESMNTISTVQGEVSDLSGNLQTLSGNVQSLDNTVQGISQDYVTSTTLNNALQNYATTSRVDGVEDDMEQYVRSIARIESSSTADYSHAVGEEFYFNKQLVKCVSAISRGDTIAIDTNVVIADRLVETVAGKQDKLVFDNAPTLGSDNMLTSGVIAGNTISNIDNGTYPPDDGEINFGYTRGGLTSTYSTEVGGWDNLVGKWTATVSCAIGATSANFTNPYTNAYVTVHPYSETVSGTPIPVTGITATANTITITFPELTEAADIKCRVTTN